MLQDQRTRNGGIGADVIVLPPGSSFIAGFHGRPMPIKIERCARQVAACEERRAGRHDGRLAAGTLEIIAGIDLTSYESMSGGFSLPRRAGLFRRRTTFWSTICFAKSKHAKVGDTIEILNNKFRISGIVERGKGARKFVPISTLQDLIGAKDKATIFYLKLDDPANVDAVVDEIKHVAGMERYVVNSMAELSRRHEHQQYSRCCLRLLM